MRKLTVGDLFSGTGGCSLGLERAGFETKWFVELDPFCNKVLAKHWPNVRRYENVKEVHGVSAHAESGQDDERNRGIVGGTTERREGSSKAACTCDKCLSPVDLIVGGFPCQPFSVAGKRGSTDDNRYLWPEMLRIIREIHPRWVIAENVPGLISIDGGMVFESVLSDLEGQGYEVQSFIIPACAVGAPHRRDRVWIVGYSTGRGECIGQQERMDGELFQARGWEQGGNGTEPPDCHATDANGTRSQGWDEHGERTGERIAWQGSTEQWSEGWYDVALRTCVRRVDDELSPRVDRVSRLKALGNAVVPTIVEILGRAILETKEMTWHR